MLFELKKAIQSRGKAGIKTSAPKLASHALPYYLPWNSDVPPPITLYWSINSVCNLRCKMCDVGMFNEEGMFFKNLRIDRKLHEVDIEVFKRVADEVAVYRPFMAINSTEPLMYKPLGEAVAYCTAKGLETAVTTGAYTLPKRADELAQAGLTRLNVSIDGAPEVHNAIRGRDDSFQMSRDGVHLFREMCEKRDHRAEIFLNCTITNMNHSGLTDFYRAVEGWPVDQINFTFMWFIDPAAAKEHNQLYGDRYPVSESCYGEFIDPHKVDIAVLYEQIQYLKQKPNVHFAPAFGREELRRYFHEPDKFMNSRPRCMATWFFLQVLADGSVIVYTRCHNQPIGNINDQSIADIWNGDKAKEWRRFIRDARVMPMCKRCDLAY